MKKPRRKGDAGRNGEDEEENETQGEMEKT